MNLNKVYLTLQLYFVEGYSNLFKISDESGLHPKLIKKVIRGEKYADVFADFMADRKAEDFSRTYPLPKTSKVSQLDYIDLYSRYLNRLLSGGTTLRDVRGYLLEDNIDVKQAEKMLKALENEYTEKIEQVIEDKLFAILEVQRKPVKWTIGADGKLVEIYPHPKLNKANRVIGIEYKTYKVIDIPDKLFDAYCTLMDDIDKAGKKTKVSVKSKSGKGSKQAKAKSLMFLWLGQYESGATYKEIAEKTDFSEPTVIKYVRKAKDQLKEVI
jgi:hypothetical protein